MPVGQATETIMRREEDKKKLHHVLVCLFLPFRVQTLRYTQQHTGTLKGPGEVCWGRGLPAHGFTRKARLSRVQRKRRKISVSTDGGSLSTCSRGLFPGGTPVLPV